MTLARSTTHSGISFTAGISNYTGAGADLLFDGLGSDTGFGFRTRNSSNTQVNALVIAPSGNVGIGTTSPSDYYPGADNLVIKQASGEGGMSIITATDTTGAIYLEMVRQETNNIEVE